MIAKTKTEKASTKKIPNELFEYINRYFEGAMLSKIETACNEDGETIYEVDASLDEILYHLKFNSHGVLISNESEPLAEFYDDDYNDF